MKTEIVKVGRKYRIRKSIKIIGLKIYSTFMSYDNGDSSGLSFDYFEFKSKKKARKFLKQSA